MESLQRAESFALYAAAIRLIRFAGQNLLAPTTRSPLILLRRHNKSILLLSTGKNDISGENN